MMFILWHSALLVGSMAIAFVAGFITARAVKQESYRGLKWLKAGNFIFYK